MVYRCISHAASGVSDSTCGIGLAIFHGTLSLIMFIGLLIFMFLAWREYENGKNYFKEHHIFTLIFLVLWFLAVISGVVFYVVEYLL